MNLHEFRQSGFSLVELTVVLLLMTLIASVAVRQTTELGFQSRYELTRDRLDQIKQAILGDPKLVSNGQRAINGFVADMGRLPTSVRELIQRQGDCSIDAGDVNAAACTDLGGVWTANVWNSDPVSSKHFSGLRYGWNGPYLSVSASPAEGDAFSDGWGRLPVGFCQNSVEFNQATCAVANWVSQANDSNYGWYFSAIVADTLTVMSYGLNQQYDDPGQPVADAFDRDFPDSQPMIHAEDWLVDLSGGISVQFIKLNRVVPLSSCSDPSKNTRNDCQDPNLTWYGGCSLAGYYNKKSCEDALPTAGDWKNGYCSDSTKTDLSSCNSPAKWNNIGEGFGCSDPTITKKADCSSPNVWYACSDKSKTTQSVCAGSDTWYGDDLGKNLSKFPINSLPVADNNVPLCMSIFFRSGNGAVQKASSVQPKSLWIDGSEGAIHFDGGFLDDDANPVRSIPMGQTAIGIYQYDGKSCQSSTVHYPVHHQSPILVDLYPKTHLPVINW